MMQAGKGRARTLRLPAYQALSCLLLFSYPGNICAVPPVASVIDSEVKAQALLSEQYLSAEQALAANLSHPIMDYPDTTFTWDACNSSNPYLVVNVRDQQVPLIVPGEPVNQTVRAFAINTWAEIEYDDPYASGLTFHIAEDLIYDVNNDTFAVATPFDVKGGHGVHSGLSSVGPDTTTTTGNASDTETYNIKFTFMASPLSSNSTPEYEPTGSVERISGGTLTDGTGSAGPAKAAFSDLVARLYFNVLTAALGNECNTGYPQLITVAAFILDRLRRLAPASSVVYNGMPLNETLILDGAQRLCIKEANTLYLGSKMTLLDATAATSEEACCHACRVWGPSVVTNATCNAWTFCGTRAGCGQRGTVSPLGACSLYYSKDLAFNVPLDTKNATLRSPHITFTSGRTVAVIPTNIMSVLVPVDGPANAQFDSYQPFSKSKYRQ